MTANPTLVFDGDCGICTASATWIRRHAGGVDVVTHHEHGVESLDKVWFIDETGRREGADAVSAVLKRCDGAPWRAMGALIGAPGIRIVARGIYWVVARNRTRLSRVLGMKACSIPAPKG